MPSPFRLHNTRTRKVEDFEPLQPGKVGLYVCGMTVYDDLHVGHSRAMVLFDMVARYLRHRGWDVTFVRNFTDVDDKIIARANDRGMDPAELAQMYIDRFHEDVAALGLAAPDHEPRVTTTMDGILEMIGKLVERGHAYPADGSVWFSVESDPRYGQLSGRKVEDMRSAETESGKRAPQDFALWKAAKEGEPSWASPWGPGRPGWHIECSAMAYATLGEQVDIHGGGIDLIFPHHENEIAQSECAHEVHPWTRYWFHNGMLTMGDAKMGKSLGNVFGLRAALEAFPAEVLRIYYLQVHYRSPLPWNVDALPDALSLLARLYEAREVAESMKGDESVLQVAQRLGKDAVTALELAQSFRKRFYAAMDDDLNTGKALGIAFELARAVNRMANHKQARKKAGPIAKKALEAFAILPDALNLLSMTSEEFQADVKAKRLPALGLTPEDVQEKIEARIAARKAKQWDEADAIRAELEDKGIEIRDSGDATDWRIRLDVREEA